MTANLQDYKDVLGKPNQEFHKERISILGLSVAYNDFIGTFFLSFLTTLLFGLPLYYSLGLKLNLRSFVIYWSSMYIFFTIFMFVFGIFLHYLFGVKSALNKLLFGEK